MYNINTFLWLSAISLRSKEYTNRCIEGSFCPSLDLLKTFTKRFFTLFFLMMFLFLGIISAFATTFQSGKNRVLQPGSSYRFIKFDFIKETSFYNQKYWDADRKFLIYSLKNVQFVYKPRMNSASNKSNELLASGIRFGLRSNSCASSFINMDLGSFFYPSLNDPTIFSVSLTPTPWNLKKMKFKSSQQFFGFLNFLKLGQTTLDVAAVFPLRVKSVSDLQSMLSTRSYQNKREFSENCAVPTNGSSVLFSDLNKTESAEESLEGKWIAEKKINLKSEPKWMLPMKIQENAKFDSVPPPKVSVEFPWGMGFKEEFGGLEISYFALNNFGNYKESFENNWYSSDSAGFAIRNFSDKGSLKRSGILLVYNSSPSQDISGSTSLGSSEFLESIRRRNINDQNLKDRVFKVLQMERELSGEGNNRLNARTIPDRAASLGGSDSRLICSKWPHAFTNPQISFRGTVTTTQNFLLHDFKFRERRREL